MSNFMFCDWHFSFSDSDPSVTDIEEAGSGRRRRRGESGGGGVYSIFTIHGNTFKMIKLREWTF